GERPLALLLLLLLPHRCPDVGGHHLCALRGFHRIADDTHLGRLLRSRQQMIGRLVTRRAGEVEVEPEAEGGVDPGIRHVVAVADPGVLLVGDIAEVLADGEQVSEHLAGMQEIGQTVDHGHVGEPGQLLDVLVGEGADHDAIDVARQHARGVGDRLAASELDVARREEEGVAAQVEGADLERDAGPRARLHEDHGERLTGERLLVVAVGAHLLGEVEERVELVAGEVGNGEEVAVAGRRHGNGSRRGSGWRENNPGPGPARKAARDGPPTNGTTDSTDERHGSNGSSGLALEPVAPRRGCFWVAGMGLCATRRARRSHLRSTIHSASHVQRPTAIHNIYFLKSSSSTIVLRQSRTTWASTTIFAEPRSGRSNRTSSRRVVITVCSRRAPIFSMRSLTRAAMRAISAMPSTLKSSVAPSASTSAAYCLVSAFSGSVMMRTKSCSVSGLSSTRMGKRPCSSGIRSLGLET